MRFFGFSLVTAVFAIIGFFGLARLYIDVPADQKANDVRLAIARLEAKGAAIEEFRRAKRRLPTDAEINCDFETCPETRNVEWHLIPEDDGTFSLTYASLVALAVVPYSFFSPLMPHYVTWHSRTGTTDQDSWEQPWRWRVQSSVVAIVWIVVTLCPWLILLALWLGRETSHLERQR